MDTRQARGEHLAQLHGARIKPVDGDLWFVPSSDGIGGYLVSTAPAAGSARCSCPDAQRGTKCKHAWAVEFAQQTQGVLPAADGTAVVPAPQRVAQPLARVPRGDLAPEEQARVRLALKALKARHGWPTLAKGLRYQEKTLKHVAYGRIVTASIAVRLARFVGSGVDDLLSGKYAPPCPHCGQTMPIVRQ